MWFKRTLTKDVAVLTISYIFLLRKIRVMAGKVWNMWVLGFNL